MTTIDVANRLVSLLRKGKFEEAQVELYADNATSVESPGDAFVNANSKQEVIEGGRKFRSTLQEVHGLEISEPIVSGSVFAISFALDATFKGSGRVLFQEICSFKVQDGKIVSSSYLY
ncbi:MAG: nuclear transport factor 2 family protein [Bacteroidota bacterium]